ncbi:Tudor domain-containing protein 7 [Dermatophagoides pteronyssinus]|uniref:Tudor domain-containing protein 7 n=1 Tax=Dermatophagoides pteronyssinus TaxID=6956 RepID=A0ABQ8J5W9_DERPT|nr:Tudor domain-containing protein 7 [Dermatophagoides pteronyssinus]
MEIESKETATTTTTDLEKRKSVSFVDEKLIDNAIKSTTVAAAEATTMANMDSNDNDDSKCKTTATTTKHGHKNHHHQNNGRSSSKNHYNNNGGNHKLYGNTTNGGRFNNHKQTPGQQSKSQSQSSSSNPVIIYYNNPDVEINVDDLLEKCQSKQQQQHETMDDNNGKNGEHKERKHHHPAQNLLSANVNKHHHHHQNGRQNGNYNHHGGGHHQKPGSSSTKHHHNQQQQQKSKNKWSNNDNNWRNHSKHQYDGSNDVNGNHHHNHQNKKPIIKKIDYHNRSSNNDNDDENKNKSTETTTATTLSSTSTIATSTEPITIYYNDNSISLEENLKRLKETLLSDENKQTDSSQSEMPYEESTTINATTSTNDNDIDTVIKMDDNTIADTTTSHEQKSEKIQVDEIQPSTTATVSTLVKSNDPEDVISGGVPIENPRLPEADANVQAKMVRCTIISHPGHFYIKFINADHERQLNGMNQFYSQDEHIELTLDVLQPGQFYAALRTKDEGWIRIKLLQAESIDQITCFLIDQGCVDILRLNQLQPLYSQFRSVPRQSIRVSLSGIRPRESDDWLPNEALEFKKLLDNQILKVDYIGNGDAKWGQIVEPDSQLQIRLQFNDDHNDSKLADRPVADILIERNLAIAN